MPFEVRSTKLVGPQKSHYRKTVESAATKIYAWRPQLCAAALTPARPTGDAVTNAIRIVCISDTHNTQPPIPPGDILLHSGDLSEFGTFAEVQAQLDWLNAQPHEHKILLGGNHDLILDPDVPIEALTAARRRLAAHNLSSTSVPIEETDRDAHDLQFGDITYLSPTNPTTTLIFPSKRTGSLKVFGSPLTRQYGQWAFQYPPIRDVWSGRIPSDADVVLTHGPPRGILDHEGAGDANLLKELMRVQPRLVVFGHIHIAAGQTTRRWNSFDMAFVDITLLERGGLACLLKLSFLIFLARVVAAFRRTARPALETILVNAAVVGGPNNEEMRNATVVDI